jgi:hypothetical protein
MQKSHQFGPLKFWDLNRCCFSEFIISNRSNIEFDGLLLLLFVDNNIFPLIICFDKEFERFSLSILRLYWDCWILFNELLWIDIICCCCCCWWCWCWWLGNGGIVNCCCSWGCFYLAACIKAVRDATYGDSE